MVCRNLCERLYSEIVFGRSQYGASPFFSPTHIKGSRFDNRKQGKNRYYSVNRKRTTELIEYRMYDYMVSALKEYVENKKKKKKLDDG